MIEKMITAAGFRTFRPGSGIAVDGGGTASGVLVKWAPLANGTPPC
jgi:hypothetical protein